MDDVVAVIGAGVMETLSDQATLRGVVIWYHMDHQRWPAQRNQIEELIIQKNAPINLSKFSTLVFEQLEDGDLKISFEKEGAYGPTTGSFTVSDEEAAEESLRNSGSMKK